MGTLDRRLARNSAAPIAVALSGGGDSLALLRLAERWAAGARRPLLALTVDHGLHPDSAAWTAFAAARAVESGAAFQALAWEGDKPAAGLPAAARAARHALLAVAAREAGATVILLGHTADDVLETEQMRAADAPGIGRLRVWSPSPVWPEGRGVMLLRPMLSVRRADLRAWLAARGETWLNDPANDDLRFARVRARYTPFPLDGGRVGDGGASAGVQVESEGGATLPIFGRPLERTPTPGPSPIEGEGGVARLVRGEAGGGLSLPLAALGGATGAVAHVLSVAVVCAGGGSTPPRRAEIERLFARLLSGAPGAATLRGARVELCGGEVLLSREPGDARRNPRPDVDGVIDGRRLASGGGWLVLDRFRAATFQVDREADLAPPQNHFLAFSQTSGTSVVKTISTQA